jgi:hypothetical protein
MSDPSDAGRYSRKQSNNGAASEGEIMKLSNVKMSFIAIGYLFLLPLTAGRLHRPFT